MQKIVFLGTPAYGHVNPTLPVVQELVQRGEQVVYYNNEEFRALIEASGADFRPYPASEFSAAGLATALQDGNLANVVILILDTTLSLLPYLVDELRRESPALVIFDGVALWGRMAASAVNARAVASICQFSFDLSSLHMQPRELLRYFGLVMPGLPRILARRRQLTRRFGKALVPQEPPLIPVRGGLNIVYTSRTLHPDIAMIDDTFRFVGPSINPQTRREDFPFDALGEGPVVYISLGTIYSGQQDFYRQCFAGLRRLPGAVRALGGQAYRSGYPGAGPGEFHRAVFCAAA